MDLFAPRHILAAALEPLPHAQSNAFGEALELTHGCRIGQKAEIATRQRRLPTCTSARPIGLAVPLPTVQGVCVHGVAEPRDATCPYASHANVPTGLDALLFLPEALRVPKALEQAVESSPILAIPTKQAAQRGAQNRYIRRVTERYGSDSVQSLANADIESVSAQRTDKATD